MVAKTNTLKAAIGLERRYRHTNPLNKVNKECQFELNYIKVKEEFNGAGCHLLPEGGTEQTSAAPASSGNKLLISTSSQINRTRKPKQVRKGLLCPRNQ